jgi:putative flippase GtrA
MGIPKVTVKHELVRYLVSGISAVCTDMLTYTLLLPSMGPSPSKTISFITATVVAYFLNKFWTFKQVEHSWPQMFKFGALYSTSLIANVAVNRTAIFIIEQYVKQLLSVEYQLSWLLATGTSTVLNYVGQKFWVFKKK